MQQTVISASIIGASMGALGFELSEPYSLQRQYGSRRSTASMVEEGGPVANVDGDD